MAHKAVSMSYLWLAISEVLQSPSKDKLMAEFLPNNDDKEYQEMSQDAKDTVEEQGKLEAHDILMITGTGQ